MAHLILVVDDDPTLREVVKLGLEELGYAVRCVESGAQAQAVLEAEPVEVVVTDLHMTGGGGIELCQRLAASRPNLPVVVITAFGSLDTAIAAIRAGAYDFILKPFEIEALQLVLDRALERQALRAEVTRLREAVGSAASVGEILGESEPIRRVRQMIQRLGDSEASVLITGESGTGKELVARALHQSGRWKAGRFIALNCSALPEGLFEGELFGTTKGAFTDARSARTGLLVEADGGTLFLDEIGDMPLTVQPKLLRALQERKVRPLGSSVEVPFGCRVLSATNRDLTEEIEAKRFRSDLFYRLNVVELQLPPLRARSGDVLPLAQHFVERFAARAEKKVVGLTSGAAAALLAYPWPGNIRELENCIHRAVALAEHDQLTVDDLPEKVREQPAARPAPEATEFVSLEEAERRHILNVLAGVGNNKSLAAQILGLDRRTLYRRLERWGVVTTTDIG